MPSSRRHSSATAAASAGSSSEKPGRTASARSTKRRTAADSSRDTSFEGNDSGPSGSSVSPRMRKAARLVTTTRTSGQRLSSSATCVAAGSTCSKLSRTRVSARPPNAPASASRTGTPPSNPRPIDVATAGSTAAGSATVSSGTKTTRSGCSAPARRAASIASRVLPIPPGPTTVTNRLPEAMLRSSSAISSVLPTRLLTGVGIGRRGGAGCSCLLRCRRLTDQESLGEQDGEVVGEQALELGGGLEGLVGDRVVRAHGVQELDKPLLAVRCRRLEVDQPRQSTREPVLVLES